MVGAEPREDDVVHHHLQKFLFRDFVQHLARDELVVFNLPADFACDRLNRFRRIPGQYLETDVMRLEKLNRLHHIVSNLIRD